LFIFREKPANRFLIGMAIAVLRESHGVTRMTEQDSRASKMLGKLAVAIFCF